MREGKVGVRYVKDAEEGWTSVVRRKMCARSESGDLVVIWTWWRETDGV